MEDEQLWLRLFDDSINKIREAYTKNEDPAYRGKILSDLEIISNRNRYREHIAEDNAKVVINGRLRRDFGLILRRLIAQHRATPKEVAQSIGVTSRTIRRWENQDSNPRDNLMLSIIDYFNVEPSVFYETK